jgi:serine/threonine-protein phosphatase 2A regulatory subunit B'|eukprot:g7624.t1
MKKSSNTANSSHGQKAGASKTIPPPEKKSSDEQASTPRADVTMPKVERRRRGSNSARSNAPRKMPDLPKLKEVSLTQRQEVFRQKLLLCEARFDFNNPMTDSQRASAEVKRNTLNELVEFVSLPSSQKFFTEAMLPRVVTMVEKNIFRALPPPDDEYNPEEDAPIFEPSWPHLCIVYEFLLRFIMSPDVTAKAAKNYVSHLFCARLVELFDTEDHRERDYLKNILHRIYGKFMSHRAFIRRTISNVFYKFVYEDERHNGIGELLEILGSIINGFALPLKKEHLAFMDRALMPLHKPRCVSLYHRQLCYCVTQYIEKDINTGILIIKKLLSYWPWSSSVKQILLLDELEEIMELITIEVLEKGGVGALLFQTLAKCLSSVHFQVAERTLLIWQNDHLIMDGILKPQHNGFVLPQILPALLDGRGDWNKNVEGLARVVIERYQSDDIELYDECKNQHEQNKRKAESERSRRDALWNKLSHA